MKSKLVFVAVFLLIISCDDTVKPSEKPACTLCDTLKRTGRIEGHISIVYFNWNRDEAFLTDFDPETQEPFWNKGFKLCNPQLLLSFYDDEIIKWSGFIHSSCDSVFQYPLVEIDSFEAAPYCPKPLPELDFVPNLSNTTWEIESVKTLDTILYRPCELSPVVWFGLFESNSVGIAYIIGGSLNYLGNSSADTLRFVKSGPGYPLEGSSNARRLEIAFLTVIEPLESPILYRIEDTHLTLQNLETKTVVVLRAVGEGK